MPPFSRALSSLLLAASVAAQCPPGAPLSQDAPLATTVPEQGAAHVRWQAAQDALKAGDAAAAKKHLLAALEFLPLAPMLLLDLALLTRDDKDVAAMWAERFVRAASDAQGRLKLDTTAKKQAAPAAGFEATLKPAQDLAAARAAAIAEVAKFVDKNRPAKQGNAARAVLVRWAAELLLELGTGSPAALAVVAPGAGRVEDAFEPDCELVFQALARVLQKKPTAATDGSGADAKTEDQRIRAARILVGLRRQGAFKDLQGPPPRDLGKYADEAQRVLDEHAAAAASAAHVFTIAELAAMSPAEADAFTRAHRDWRAPGIAASTTGRYRIETICGHDTLLATAKTIELHHARLVSHFGSDPFEQRPGLVRIVPESSDLETEGAPFWWAGGFQAGDRTTVRFSWGRIPDLGRALTHELTHRFDGVLHAFVPPWYGEGHAQWTAGHYAKMADAQCIENWLDKHPPAHTWYKGYGDRAKFETLLAGKVADYRDNYFAGYSLYAFLRSYPPKAPRYRDALDKFERTARAGQKDAIAFFTATFCDGKHGRPAKFDELFEDWQTFCRGCYDWLDNRREGNQWLAGYGGRDEVEHGDLVMDPPTWSWARHRAEPFFGQDHAVAATLLLQEVGDLDGTIAAGVWSATVDGWRADTARAVLQALLATKSADAAAAFAAVARRRFPELAHGDAAGLLAALPRTKLFLDALAQRAEALAAESPTSCGALVTDHARIAALFGIDRLRKLPLGSPAAQSQPRCLGLGGWTESGLTGYEDRRVRGLWYATNDGDLHVGREKPREGTGTLDRAAHQRDAFVHTVEWLAPGAYVVRGHVQITTSFASGAIVFGHTRRDRDLRLAFSTGDFDYATGRSEKNDHAGTVQFHLQGLWERDGRLPGSEDSHSVPINAESPAFDFALHVRGPRVLVEINGEALLRYSVHDGAPIEGNVGFAMNMGAIKVQQLTVQRRAGELADLDVGLALDAQPSSSLEDLLLLPTRGIPVHDNGTLVLWLPKVAEGSPTDRLSRVLPALAKLLNTPHEHPQDWVLAVPRDLPKAARDAANTEIAAIHNAPLPVIEHDVGEPLAGDSPFVLFVDAEGVLRAAAAADEPGVHVRVAKWSRMFRGRRA
jgi:hypothetical protein